MVPFPSRSPFYLNRFYVNALLSSLIICVYCWLRFIETSSYNAHHGHIVKFAKSRSTNSLGLRTSSGSAKSIQAVCPALYNNRVGSSKLNFFELVASFKENDWKLLFSSYFNCQPLLPFSRRERYGNICVLFYTEYFPKIFYDPNGV